MYEIHVGTGTVSWDPDHTNHAVTAMNEFVDELFQEDDSPIEVSRGKATQVNQRYRELVKNDPEINPPEETEQATEVTDQPTEETQ